MLKCQLATLQGPFLIFVDFCRLYYVVAITSINNLLEIDPESSSRCSKSRTTRGTLRLRNDLYCVEWGVKLYSLSPAVRIVNYVILQWHGTNHQNYCITDRQCAAVSIQCWSIMLPPHVWYQPYFPRRWTLTCQGHTHRFASWPPTMRFLNSGDSNGTPHNCMSPSCQQRQFRTYSKRQTSFHRHVIARDSQKVGSSR